MNNAKIKSKVNATMKSNKTDHNGAKMSGRWDFVCRDKNGDEKWRDVIDNMIVNVGLDYMLDVSLSGATATTAWYIGLTDGTPTPAAGDTMSSHAGWAEVAAYDESVRQTWDEAGVSSQSITNSASAAVFTISTNSTTTGGAFLASSSTKSETASTLFSVGAFSAGDKLLDDGDTLTVTVTYTLADS